MAPPTVGEMMEAYAEDAVQHAKQSFHLDLDYSPGSIRYVEQVIQTLYADMPRGFFARLFRKSIPDRQIAVICKMYGGYIGEVLRRSVPGEWVFDTEIAPGQQTICLRKGDTRIYPPSKVHKRLMNGSEDNLWYYYQVMVKEVWKP